MFKITDIRQIDSKLEIVVRVRCSALKMRHSLNLL